MKQTLFLIFVMIVFSGCFATKNIGYSSKKDVLVFETGDEKPYTYHLIKPKVQYTYDNCTNNSYTIEDARLFLEYVTLKNHCNWNGSSYGYFEYQLKQKLKLKSLTAISRYEVSNYVFSTLKVNGTHKLQTIHQWGGGDLFIIDYDGVLTFSLQKKLNVHNKVASSALPRYVKRYNESVAQMNFFYHYFSPERIED